MIGCSIALTVWTAGLSFLTHRDSARRRQVDINLAGAENTEEKASGEPVEDV